MSDIPDRTRPTSPLGRKARSRWLADIGGHLIATAISIGIVLVALWAYLDDLLAYLLYVGLRPNLPGLAEVQAIPPLIALHAGGALASLVLGAVVLFGHKGTALHKALGRVWVGAMALTAGSSVFIQSFQPVIGPFGVIHIFTIWTAWTLPMAILQARRGNIEAHRNMMTGLYFGLWIAGLFTLLPGRTLFGLFLQ